MLLTEQLHVQSSLKYDNIAAVVLSNCVFFCNYIYILNEEQATMAILNGIEEFFVHLYFYPIDLRRYVITMAFADSFDPISVTNRLSISTTSLSVLLSIVKFCRHNDNLASDMSKDRRRRKKQQTEHKKFRIKVKYFTRNKKEIRKIMIFLWFKEFFFFKIKKRKKRKQCCKLPLHSRRPYACGEWLKRQSGQTCLMWAANE